MNQRQRHIYQELLLGMGEARAGGVREDNAAPIETLAVLIGRVQGLRLLHEHTPWGLRWLVWMLVQAPLRELRKQLDDCEQHCRRLLQERR